MSGTRSAATTERPASSPIPEGDARFRSGRLDWDRRTPSAFETVEHEARQGLTTGDAGTALVRLITFSGRLPFDRAIRSLTRWERAIVEGVLGQPDLQITAEPGDGDPTVSVVIAQGPLGKASLYPAAEELTADARPIGAMAVPHPLLERANDIAAEYERLETVARAGLERCLERAEGSEGGLASLVADVRDRIDHVESIYVYIGRRTFCRSDVGNTLLRGGRLERLERLPLIAWDADERLFVAAFYVVFLSGRSIRIEEFNGEQLSATRVWKWLLRKWQLYRLELGRPGGTEPPTDLEHLGQDVGELRVGLEAAGSYGFRRINGLTMAKHEFIGRLDDLQPAALAPPPLVRQHVGHLGLAAMSLDAHEMVKRATRSALAAGDVKAVEGLLERIVLSAVLTADADYGMSSGVRDLSRLRGGPGGCGEGVLTLAKSDFFCATLPHPSLVERLDSEVMRDILHSVAKRMQFNRWHFLPGNLARDEVPDTRHFFYPPSMPDIAEWSDLRHPGHTNASVRYTVRAPGPALWQPPLRVFGLDLRGCFDIRLVRMTEPPFTRAQMRVACQHCHLVDALWRVVAETVESGNPAAAVVAGFTREDYYDVAAWSEAVEEARVLTEVPA